MKEYEWRLIRDTIKAIIIIKKQRKWIQYWKEACDTSFLKHIWVASLKWNEQWIFIRVLEKPVFRRLKIPVEQNVIKNIRYWL